MKKYIFLFILILHNQYNYALIIESNKLEIVLHHITPGTLVIFDIDNTLARPIAELSSDEWFCHLVNTKMSQGHDYITSVYYSLPIAYYAQFNVDLVPTEDIVSNLLTEIINNTIATMALSSRSLFVAERTLEQLEHININFFIPYISQEDLLLPMIYPCFYKNSVLFSGNNDKGEALIQFFEHMNYYPQKVIFIDDKMKCLLSVEKALELYSIPFVGIRYGGCDDHVQNFDPQKAEEQWLLLRHKKYNTADLPKDIQ